MFGLMRPEHSCTIDRQDANYIHHRRHYCGTCKTMGSRYGQRSRLMLNFDTVFLAELLSELLEEDTSQWQSSFQAINQCFAMPNKKEQMPFSLEYAAAVNVLLGTLKMEDKTVDSKGMRWVWKGVSTLFAKSKHRANRQFREWGIDTQAIWQLTAQQKSLETQAESDFETIEELLAYYAQPTAEITAFLFEQGIIKAGKPESAGTMKALGYVFGQLAYILDAAEDRAKDSNNRSFNPFLLFWEDSFSEEKKAVIENLVLDLQARVSEQLGALPLQMARIEEFSARLLTNVAKRFQKPQFKPLSGRAQLQMRWQYAVDFAKKMTCNSASPLRPVYQNIIALAVFVLPRTAAQIDGQVPASGWSLLSVFSAFFIAFAAGFLPRSKKKKAACKPKFKSVKSLKEDDIPNPCDCCNQCNRECAACCQNIGIIFMQVFIIGLILVAIGGVIYGTILLFLGISIGWLYFMMLGIAPTLVITLIVLSYSDMGIEGKTYFCQDMTEIAYGWYLTEIIVLSALFILSIIMGIIMWSIGTYLIAGIFLLGISLLVIVIIWFVWFMRDTLNDICCP